MPIYILATRLSPDAATRKFQHYEEEGQSWLDLVHKKCPEATFLEHYTILGPWDFLDNGCRLYNAQDTSCFESTECGPVWPKGPCPCGRGPVWP